MPQKIRMWEVNRENTPIELPATEISLEERLEDWLESDISMLDPDLMVIGRQVRTDFGGEIDLLCLDGAGDTVVVELKKGRTPREVTAQTLDYASWVKDLGPDRIQQIAASYPKLTSPLTEAFEAQFGQQLPDELNLNHRSLIVAESIDDSTERIVRYLSDLHVPVNIATVQHFKTAEGREMLAQAFLVEPNVAEIKSQSKSRRHRPSRAEILAAAEEHGVGELYRRIDEGVGETLEARPSSSPPDGKYVRYQARLDSSRNRAVLYVCPEKSDKNGGLCFRIQATWLADFLGSDIETLKSWLPQDIEELDASKWVGSSPEERVGAKGLGGTFSTTEEVDKFIGELKARVQQGTGD